MLQIFVEPRDHLAHSISLVLRFDEEMAFAGIYDELGRHVERLQSVPEFVRLCRRAFRVTFADDDEGRCLHVFDEANRRVFLVNRGIVVN